MSKTIQKENIGNNIPSYGKQINQKYLRIV